MKQQRLHGTFQRYTSSRVPSGFLGPPTHSLQRSKDPKIQRARNLFKMPLPFLSPSISTTKYQKYNRTAMLPFIPRTWSSFRNKPLTSGMATVHSFAPSCRVMQTNASPDGVCVCVCGVSTAPYRMHRCFPQHKRPRILPFQIRKVPPPPPPPPSRPLPLSMYCSLELLLFHHRQRSLPLTLFFFIIVASKAADQFVLRVMVRSPIKYSFALCSNSLLLNFMNTAFVSRPVNV